MNYKMHYNRLIERAKTRNIDEGYERHHIIPKCMGGNNKENIVRLTPEEHYVAHQLLVKMYPENRYLVLAVKMMTVSGGNVVRNNKMFGWLRRKFSEAMKQQIFSDETKLLISEAGKRPCKESTKIKIGLANKGKANPHKGRKIIPVECPYCSKIGAGGSMVKYHFENCKEKYVY